jgi:S-DNA-T family DNA segregation ATPase FtsK/SpoIIIE
VLLQTILLGIAATNTPAEAEIVLIDPKLGVDYLVIEDLPHLRGGPIYDQMEASARLRALVEEMDARYDRFRDVKAKDLRAYNGKVPPEQRLPTLWVVHDEVAEWTLQQGYLNQLVEILGRLGAKARAAGIYLIFATQRPSQEVVPLQLRTNLGNRLALKVDSEGTSDIALGAPGAQDLLGKGHLLAKLDGASGLQYAQVPLVDEDFMERLVNGIMVEHAETVGETFEDRD